jgi:hypothetical protein
MRRLAFILALLALLALLLPFAAQAQQPVGQGAAAPGLTLGTPITGGTTNQLLYDNAGVVGEITKGNSCVYLTNGSGVPSCSTTLPSGVGYQAPTLGSTSIGSGATVTAITGMASFGITAPVANTTPLTISGYSLTGSDTHALGSYSGTVNTSGDAVVLDTQITVTALGAGGFIERIRGGVAGTAVLRTLDTSGSEVIAGNFKLGPTSGITFGTTRGGIETGADASFGFFNHTGGTEAYLSVLANGSFGIGASASGTDGKLAMTSLGLPTTNFADNATCATANQFLGASATFLYICTAANTVGRIAIAAF